MQTIIQVRKFDRRLAVHTY